MKGRPRAVVAWSSGKDSAYALHVARRRELVEIVGLLCTLTEGFGRVSMHGVREELLDLQVSSLAMPCTKVWIPTPCSNELYETRMAEALEGLRARGVSYVVFGDLFLRDLRAFREAQLARVGMQGIFPLWQRDTAQLAREMMDSGVRASITCVDSRVLDRSFVGRAFDAAFLDELPPEVDPCGENGEFHTVVLEGPMFERAISANLGEVMEREGFIFADVVPASARIRPVHGERST